LKAIDVTWKPNNDISGAYKLQVICLQAKFNIKTNEMDKKACGELQN
tara:strand:+ start:3500 stop:3640 length:141 start_codon:yes stop_codon:yes gene_type:complete